MILIPFWKRPEISEICFSGLDRIRKYRENLEVLAIISEDNYKARCDRHDIEYTFFENLPLGRKKNHGLRVSLEKDWDYLMELNSDDVIKNDLLDLYDNQNADYMGVGNFCFINSQTKECRQYSSNSMYGIGRRYSRKLIEQVGELWKDDANARMDNYSDWKIWQTVKVDGKRIFSDEPLAADIKSDVNIWKWNPEAGQPYELEKFLEGLSKQEIECLESL